MKLDFEIFRGEKYTKLWLVFWSLVFVGLILFLNKGYFEEKLNKDLIVVDIKDSSKLIKDGLVELDFIEGAIAKITQNSRISVAKIIVENGNLEIYKNNKLLSFKNSNTRILFLKNTDLTIQSNSKATVKVSFKTVNLKAIIVVFLLILFWILLLVFSYMKNQAPLTIGIFAVYILTMYAEKVTFNQNIILSSMFGTFLLLALILFILIYLNSYAKKINRENYFSIFTGFIFFVIAVVPISLISYYISFGVGFGAEAVHAILQTNNDEAIDFFLEFISIKAILFFIFVSLLLFYISIWHKKNDIKDSKKSLIGVLIAILLVLSFVYAKNTRLPKFFTNAYNQYISELNEFKELQNKRKTDPINASKSEAGETYIFIIGESHNKNHMQIYGYPRETTPRLKEFLDKNEIVKFDNIYSNHTHTMPVLSLALTEASQYNNKSYFDSASIVEVLNASGFETTWLTNQNLLGAWDNLVSIIANQADTVVGINKSIGKTTKTQKYDGDLIPYLEKILDKKSSKNRAIFVHLMGSHGGYCARFPDDFKIFKEELNQATFGRKIAEDKSLKDIVNCYDNSVLYNDFVVSNIIKKIKEKDGVNALVYMADHADDVFGKLGHNSGKFTFEMTQIPMLAYFSKEYQEKHKNSYETFVQNHDRLFSNDMYYDTLIGITGVKTEFYNSKFDLSSKEYELKDEDAKTLHGKRNYNDKDNYFYWQKQNVKSLKQDNLADKFFPHRVDSFGKLNDVWQSGYRSFEVDMVFNYKKDGKFYVGHNHPVMGTDLESFLSSVDYKKINRMWFDFKNLNNETQKVAKEELERLDKIFNLKEKVILESSWISNEFSKFSDSGWHTSYYLPTGKIVDLLK